MCSLRSLLQLHLHYLFLCCSLTVMIAWNSSLITNLFPCCPHDCRSHFFRLIESVCLLSHWTHLFLSGYNILLHITFVNTFCLIFIKTAGCTNFSPLLSFDWNFPEICNIIYMLCGKGRERNLPALAHFMHLLADAPACQAIGLAADTPAVLRSADWRAETLPASAASAPHSDRPSPCSHTPAVFVQAAGNPSDSNAGIPAPQCRQRCAAQASDTPRRARDR